MKQQNPHTLAVEESLRQFYDSEGWKSDGEVSKDAALWEDTRTCARSYVSRCRLRVMDYLPSSGDLFLDAASGPVQYPEYLAYSRGFQKRLCVDLSEEALRQAKGKLGNHGEYLHCSILDLPLPDNHVDAAVSLHTIYHIEASAQEAAVRQLLRVTKPGSVLLIVYANPDRLSSRVARALRGLLRLFKGRQSQDEKGEIYYHAHSLSWWSRFTDTSELNIVAWRTLTAKLSRRVIPDNAIGSACFRFLFWLETSFPHGMLPLAAYPLIVLRKKPNLS